MPLLPPYPPLPLLSPDQLRAAALLAAYLAVGLTYLRRVGLTASWFTVWRREVGVGLAADAASAATWCIVVLLWPVPLARRTARAWDARSGATAEAITRRPAGQSAELVSPPAGDHAQPGLTPGHPLVAPAFPEEVARDRASVVRAVEQNRLADAVRQATAHVDGMARQFGPSHPFTAEAFEILAHVSVLVGDDQRALAYYVHAADRRHRCPLLPAVDPAPELTARARAAVGLQHTQRSAHPAPRQGDTSNLAAAVAR